MAPSSRVLNYGVGGLASGFGGRYQGSVVVRTLREV
jgi:hypothetical protein